MLFYIFAGMKRRILFIFLIVLAVLTGCEPKEASHVILIEFEGMGADGLEMAQTPNFNHMIENGSVTVSDRSENLFQVTLEEVRAFKPSARVYGYLEGGAQGRDPEVFDNVTYNSEATRKKYGADDLLTMAFGDYLQDEPEMLFVSINRPYQVGSKYGFGSDEYFDCIQHMDERVGEFLAKLEAGDKLKDAVVIVTGNQSGGDDEHLIPKIMYGKGVSLSDDGSYVPMPRVHPYKGVVPAGKKVSITSDVYGAEIYYTLDGSKPTGNSTKYEGPFELDGPARIQSVAVKNGNYSRVSTNFLEGLSSAGEPAVEYRLYRRWMGQTLPDFSVFGKADAEGTVGAFSLGGLPIKAGDDYFAVIFNSTLVIKKTAKYRFVLSSDDGSRLYIDGELVIDNNGVHTLESKDAVIKLEAGDHSICVEYFDDTADQHLEVLFNTLDLDPRPIAPADLAR